MKRLLHRVLSHAHFDADLSLSWPPVFANEEFLQTLEQLPVFAARYSDSNRVSTCSSIANASQRRRRRSPLMFLATPTSVTPNRVVQPGQYEDRSRTA